MRVLLDTNICIYMIKNKPPEARKHFERFVPGDIAISSITVAALQYGVEKSSAREKDALALEAFLLPLDIAPFDTESALVYGKIRAGLESQGKPIGSMDMLIAAQAIAQGVTLITHNLKKFGRIPASSAKHGLIRDRLHQANLNPCFSIELAFESKRINECIKFKIYAKI